MAQNLRPRAVFNGSWITSIIRGTHDGPPGHTTTGMLFAHYREVVTLGDAEDYWGFCLQARFAAPTSIDWDLS